MTKTFLSLVNPYNRLTRLGYHSSNATEYLYISKARHVVPVTAKGLNDHFYDVNKKFGGRTGFGIWL